MEVQDISNSRLTAKATVNVYFLKYSQISKTNRIPNTYQLIATLTAKERSMSYYINVNEQRAHEVKRPQ